MKKVFFTLALLVISLATYAQQTEPSGCTMSVENITIKPGKSATFELLLNNERQDLDLFSGYINIPDGWTLAKPVATTRNSAWAFSAPSDHGSTTRFYVLGYDGDNATKITGTSGSIATLTLTAPAGLTVGTTYEITWDGILLSAKGAELEVDDFSFTVTVVEDALDLYDTDETAPAASTETKVTIHRDFVANKWNTFVAPFAISAAQYKAAFGDDVQIAEFSDQDIEDAENTISLAFSTITSTEANYPVIIKPSANLTEVTFEGTIEVEPDDAEYHVGNKKKEWSFIYGTYVPKTIIPDPDNEEYPLYLTNNKFWYAPAEGVTMKGYRAYFVMVETPNAWKEQYEVKMYIDEDLTAINGVEVDRTNGKVYTVDGKYVGKDVNRMQKGVYIVNGKKVIK